MKECIVKDYKEQFEEFKLDDQLKEQFVNFETEWGTKTLPKKEYRVVTIIKDSKQMVMED
jgi:hypothetical protein